MSSPSCNCLSSESEPPPKKNKDVSSSKRENLDEGEKVLVKGEWCTDFESTIAAVEDDEASVLGEDSATFIAEVFDNDITIKSFCFVDTSKLVGVLCKDNVADEPIRIASKDEASVVNEDSTIFCLDDTAKSIDDNITGEPVDDVKSVLNEDLRTFCAKPLNDDIAGEPPMQVTSKDDVKSVLNEVYTIFCLDDIAKCIDDFCKNDNIIGVPVEVIRRSKDDVKSVEASVLNEDLRNFCLALAETAEKSIPHKSTDDAKSNEASVLKEDSTTFCLDDTTRPEDVFCKDDNITGERHKSKDDVEASVLNEDSTTCCLDDTLADADEPEDDEPMQITSKDDVKSVEASVLNEDSTTCCLDNTLADAAEPEDDNIVGEPMQITSTDDVKSVEASVLNENSTTFCLDDTLADAAEPEDVLCSKDDVKSVEASVLNEDSTTFCLDDTLADAAEPEDDDIVGEPMQITSKHDVKSVEASVLNENSTTFCLDDTLADAAEPEDVFCSKDDVKSVKASVLNENSTTFCLDDTLADTAEPEDDDIVGEPMQITSKDDVKSVEASVLNENSTTFCLDDTLADAAEPEDVFCSKDDVKSVKASVLNENSTTFCLDDTLADAAEPEDIFCKDDVAGEPIQSILHKIMDDVKSVEVSVLHEDSTIFCVDDALAKLEEVFCKNERHKSKDDVEASVLNDDNIAGEPESVLNKDSTTVCKVDEPLQGNNNRDTNEEPKTGKTSKIPRPSSKAKLNASMETEARQCIRIFKRDSNEYTCMGKVKLTKLVIPKVEVNKCTSSSIKISAKEKISCIPETIKAIRKSDEMRNKRDKPCKDGTCMKVHTGRGELEQFEDGRKIIKVADKSEATGVTGRGELEQFEDGRKIIKVADKSETTGVTGRGELEQFEDGRKIIKVADKSKTTGATGRGELEQFEDGSKRIKVADKSKTTGVTGRGELEQLENGRKIIKVADKSETTGVTSASKAGPEEMMRKIRRSDEMRSKTKECKDTCKCKPRVGDTKVNTGREESEQSVDGRKRNKFAVKSQTTSVTRSSKTGPEEAMRKSRKSDEIRSKTRAVKTCKSKQCKDATCGINMKFCADSKSDETDTEDLQFENEGRKIIEATTPSNPPDPKDATSSGDDAEKKPPASNRFPNYVKNLIGEITCLCKKPYAAPKFTKNESRIRPTISTLRLGLESLNEKCKNKDIIISSLRNELQHHAESKVFSDMLCRAANPIGRKRDFDRYMVLQDLPVSELLRKFCDCSQAQLEGFCKTDPAPLQIVDVKKIAGRCVLVRWVASGRREIVGYEIYLDGVIETRVLKRETTTAVLNWEGESGKGVNISIYAFTEEGRCLPPATAEYSTVVEVRGNTNK